MQALKVLIDQYLDPSEELEQFRFTPIHKIVFGLSQVDLFAQLELSTIDIDAVCSFGRSPFLWAVQSGNETMAKRLLELGARVDVRDKKGWTAFHLAVYNAEPEMLEILISAAYSQLRSRFVAYYLGSDFVYYAN